MNVFRTLLLISVVACICGCANVVADKPSVRMVDYSQAPKARELAERARRLGNEVYPKILTLLADHLSKSPPQFDIVFKKDLKGNFGQTMGATINLRADWFARNPADLDALLVHEMTHVAQQCGTDAAFHWVEGIADYVCFKFGYTNGGKLPACSASYPHYASGYCCAGAFLLYVDKTHGSNVVRQLNMELRRGSYSDEFFAQATGKSLDELWAEFQKTPAFTPVAAEVNRINEALGYVNGQPPKDVAARFRAYVEQQPGGDLTLEAAEFLGSLVEKDQLAGIIKNERRTGAANNTFTVYIDPLNLKESTSAAYPASRTLFGRKADDPTTYHYTVVRTSKESAWQVQKAWRTAPDGRLLEEYSIK